LAKNAGRFFKTEFVRFRLKGKGSEKPSLCLDRQKFLNSFCRRFFALFVCLPTESLSLAVGFGSGKKAVCTDGFVFSGIRKKCG